jgi:hypothetical protein
MAGSVRVFPLQHTAVLDACPMQRLYVSRVSMWEEVKGVDA